LHVRTVSVSQPIVISIFKWHYKLGSILPK